MKRQLVFVLILVAAAALLLAIPSTASLQGTTGWLVTCTYSHALPDDPIVHPFAPGASHVHDFLANTSTTANSTYQTLTQSPTNCEDPGDTSSEWSPALYRSGVKVNPAGSGTRDQIYYRADNLAVGTHVHTIPAGLKMVVGKATATSVADNARLGSEIYYGCSDNTPDNKYTAPINCSTGVISVHFGFPNCWDGVNLDSADHISHMAYPSYPAGTCPADHPVAIPRIILRWEYPVGTDGPVGTPMTTITLASGPTYTEHADYWNTWNQQRLDALVDDCMNQFRDCGTPGNASVGPTPSPTATSTPSLTPTPAPTITPSPTPSPSPTRRHCRHHSC